MVHLRSVVCLSLLSVTAYAVNAALDDGAHGDSLDIVKTYRSSREDSDWTALRTAAQAQATATGLANSTSLYQHFTITQAVAALGFDQPLREAECKDVTEINTMFLKNINVGYKALAKAVTGLSATTTLLQKQTHCSYTTAVTYVGSAELKQQLVAAASSDELCQAVARYCQATFPPDGHYRLQATSADPDAPLPPVVSFSCVKSFYNQRLDHFDTAEARTWKQLYYVCDKSWPAATAEQEASGTVLVFLGNESPLDTPQQPIIFENADRHNALVILVEHRYYGESIPVPMDADQQILASDFKWLSIEQVIEDTTAILNHVRATRKVPSSVPTVVVGGSYGGQIAAYHRLTKPGVFGAAVAASAPVTLVPGTRMWSATSNYYYKQVGKSAATMGGPSCFLTVHKAVSAIGEEIKTPEGRQRIGKLFNLCQSTPIKSYKSGREFALTTVDAFESIAQTNNQPPDLGRMEDACGVVQSSVASGATALQALAELFKYQRTSGHPDWCYQFRYSPDTPGHIPDTPPKVSMYDAYSYQCCTQGTVHGGLVPAQGTADTFYPRYHVSLKDHLRSCREAFGSGLPAYQAPAFVTTIKQLVEEIGGIVFTNGELDTWAGGSWTSLADVLATPSTGNDTASSADATEGFGTKGRFSAHTSLQPQDVNSKIQPYGQLAFVVYKNASHCTDTHTSTWNQPGEPAVWKQQRAEAMDHAVRMARGLYNV